jgi:microcystin-dependent protein
MEGFLNILNLKFNSMKNIFLSIITLCVFNFTFAQTGYIGEIRLASFNFAPRYWLPCDGRLMPINQNQALFSILGTIYGGNGTTNFALPDLRDKIAVGYSSTAPLGATTSNSSATITSSNLPVHNHVVPVHVSTAAATTSIPSSSQSLGAPREYLNNNYYQLKGYNNSPANQTLYGTTTSNAGELSPIPISTIQPIIGLTYMICINGVYPSRN